MGFCETQQEQLLSRRRIKDGNSLLSVKFLFEDINISCNSLKYREKLIVTLNAKEKLRQTWWESMRNWGKHDENQSIMAN